MNQIILRIKNYSNQNPLHFVLLVGMLFRMIAAIFSRGFGMHDDHFLIIEAAQSWIDKTDYNAWLPKDGQTIPTPTGHSFFYTGLHYVFFRILTFLGILHPQIKMLLVRLAHAIYSMITIYYGFKITEKIAGVEVAKKVGLFLSLFWIFPFLCVRNLVEMACVPPLIIATWLAIKNENIKWYNAILIGLILGIGFNIRFQTILFTCGFGLALFIERKFIAGILVGFGFLICAALFQGGIDLIIWKQPFVEFAEYVRYNLENSTTYYDQPWYNYLLLLMGIFIPPINLMLLFGFFKNYKKWILFLPSLIFLAAHSYFPNKQERFVLPIFPFIIMLGLIGWNEFKMQSTFWKKNEKLESGFWKFFWVLNCFLLIVITPTYSKRSRVEAMLYLREKGDVKNLIIENSNREGGLMSAHFYLSKWVTDYTITNSQQPEAAYQSISQMPDSTQPNYIVFYEADNIEKRVAAAKNIFALTFETKIEPSFIDDFMYKINPSNKNAEVFIYKISQKK
ncbi:MAG: hypothetical protein RL065_2255 [Bacteroidota bacterium]|jgi:hypothetical protein